MAEHTMHCTCAMPCITSHWSINCSVFFCGHSSRVLIFYFSIPNLRVFFFSRPKWFFCDSVEINSIVGFVFVNKLVVHRFLAAAHYILAGKLWAHVTDNKFQLSMRASLTRTQKCSFQRAIFFRLVSGISAIIIFKSHSAPIWQQ